MAAAVAVSQAIDLKTQASIPLRLGASILASAEAAAYSTVRYNHKPQLKSGDNVSSVLKTSKDGAVKLELRDGTEEYGYNGQAADDSNRFILFCRGAGNDKELVLERLSHVHSFNLTSTPSETDVSKLAERYKQLPLGDEDGQDDTDEEPIDANNPFDYRNHLNNTSHSKPDQTGADTPRSVAATPRVVPRATTSTPVVQPKRPAASTSTAASAKRKGGNPLKPNPKRVKAGTEPPPPAPTTTSKLKAKVPAVRLDRKASLRRPSIDDFGELVLENETPVTERPPRAPGAMALALSGQLGAGPISLRSAASSPASRVASPALQRPDGVASPEEFELGEESSPEANSKRTAVKSPGDYFSGTGEADEDDADADVEDLELPSPRQARKSMGVVGDGGGDEDYDMERELELALAADDGTANAVTNESDEESEEE